MHSFPGSAGGKCIKDILDRAERLFSYGGGGLDTEKALLGWLGKWEMIIRDRAGNIIERTGLRPNLITDAGLNMFRDLLSGAITDGEIKYVALGSGSTAPANDQTQLVAEEFRKLVTSQTNQAAAGELETILFVADSEANTFTTEEIGWFAGAAASATANTGIMIARVLYSRAKTNMESWTIRRLDKVTRGS